MRKLTTYVMRLGQEAALREKPECAISPVEK
jgi:hypothetical protein